MKSRQLIGKLISFEYADRAMPITGILLEYNEEWTLLRYNPIDYLLDGFVILRNKHVMGYSRGTSEKFTEKVIAKKNYKILPQNAISLTDVPGILQQITETYGLVMFQLKAERKCYVGKFVSYEERRLKIKNLDARARWTGERNFRPGDIRTIEFDTDYLNSLKLVMN